MKKFALLFIVCALSMSLLACENSGLNATSYATDPTNAYATKPTINANMSTTPTENTETLHIHNWVAATCTAPKTCTVCGATEGDSKDHNWQEATYTLPKTCTSCGATEGEPLVKPGSENYHGHVYTGGEYSKKFHYEAGCAGKNSHEITWDEVQKRGLDPCGTCVLK